ncbi:MAG: DUF4876 domain-containing protein [Marinifilaceae bacterium]
MKLIVKILSLVVLFVMVACISDKQDYGTIKLHVKLEGETGDLREESPASEGIKVSVVNQTNGLNYVAYADAYGDLCVNVEYGFYNVVAQHRNFKVVYNGRRERVLVNNTNDIVSDTLLMAAAPIRQPIIKEVYYSGCYTEAGKGYLNDQYIVLYNNGDYPVALDSLCLGLVYPATSNNLSAFMTDEKYKGLLPVQDAIWQFPGKGSDIVLEPGQEITIAANAVNHKDRHPKSINLSKVNYAFWNERFSSNMEVPSFGVMPLHLVSCKGTLNKFTLALTGSAIILFRINNDDNTFFDRKENIGKNPGNASDKKEYVMVPQEWVIDGVECANGKSNVHKRLTSMVDAGYISQKDNYTGIAVHRKQESTKDGRIVYMDTNNSSEDFELVTPTLKGEAK